MTIHRDDGAWRGRAEIGTAIGSTAVTVSVVTVLPESCHAIFARYGRLVEVSRET
jgi:hypothetical protein